LERSSRPADDSRKDFHSLSGGIMEERLHEALSSALFLKVEVKILAAATSWLAGPMPIVFLFLKGWRREGTIG